MAGKLTDRLRRLHKSRSTIPREHTESVSPFDLKTETATDADTQSSCKNDALTGPHDVDNATEMTNPADPENEPLPRPSPKDGSTPGSDASTIGDTLRRSYALRGRGGRSAPDEPLSRKAERGGEILEPLPRKANRGRGTSMARGPGPLGSRLEELRKNAEDHLADGDMETARLCFLEMVALFPNHPIALSHLVALSEHRGDEVLRRHFQARLDSASPY